MTHWEPGFAISFSVGRRREGISSPMPSRLIVLPPPTLPKLASSGNNRSLAPKLWLTEKVIKFVSRLFESSEPGQ